MQGRPLITYAMDHLLAVGVERFIVNTHHCAAAYEKAFPENSWQGSPIQFRFEPILLNTGGGLKNIEDLLENDPALWIYNGDILTDIPLTHLLARTPGPAAARSPWLCEPQDRPETSVSMRWAASAIFVSSWAGMRHNMVFSQVSIWWEKRFLQRLLAGRQGRHRHRLS